MKRVFLLIAAVVLSTSMYAQDEASVTAVVDNEVVEVSATQNPEIEKHITEALKSDENLQKEAINYLKENPETASSVADIIAANGDSLDAVIAAVLGDSELATSAVNFIKDNPEMLNKAMQLAGM